MDGVVMVLAPQPFRAQAGVFRQLVFHERNADLTQLHNKEVTSELTNMNRFQLCIQPDVCGTSFLIFAPGKKIRLEHQRNPTSPLRLAESFPNFDHWWLTLHVDRSARRRWLFSCDDDGI